MNEEQEQQLLNEVKALRTTVAYLIDTIKYMLRDENDIAARSFGYARSHFEALFLSKEKK
jgi:hypothetical protein